MFDKHYEIIVIFLMIITDFISNINVKYTMKKT